MSKIHYSKRYSTPENTITNNTLQLLARICQNSATRASKFLTDITGVTEVTGEPVEIGIEISQQEKAKKSVPDGTIIQRSFRILIESKIDSEFDEKQLLRHAEGFES